MSLPYRLPTYQPSKKLLSRNDKICRLRVERNMTIYELADQFKLSKSRIQQILEKNLVEYFKKNKKS